MIRKISKTVGSVVIHDDDSDQWSMKWAIEQAYGKNSRGEEGLFYFNSGAACSVVSEDNRVYYVSTVPGGYIESTDPEFYKYAYTYKDLLKICNNNKQILNEVVELLNGQNPREVYEEVKKTYRPPKETYTRKTNSGYKKRKRFG